MAEPTLGSKGAEHFGQHTRFQYCSVCATPPPPQVKKLGWQPLGRARPYCWPWRPQALVPGARRWADRSDGVAHAAERSSPARALPGAEERLLRNALGRTRGVWLTVRLVKCFSAIEAGAGGPHGLLGVAESRRGAADRRISGRRRLLRAEAPMRAAQHASTGRQPRAACLEPRRTNIMP